MATHPIPQWNNLGLLPPVNPKNPTGTDPDRSPYLASELDAEANAYLTS